MDIPEIVVQPASLLSVPEGDNVIFTVEVIGELLFYQWWKNGVDIGDMSDTYVGTTSNNLTVLSVTDPDDNGMYSMWIYLMELVKLHLSLLP